MECPPTERAWYEQWIACGCPSALPLPLLLTIPDSFAAHVVRAEEIMRAKEDRDEDEETSEVLGQALEPFSGEFYWAADEWLHFSMADQGDTHNYGYDLEEYSVSGFSVAKRYFLSFVWEVFVRYSLEWLPAPQDDPERNVAVLLQHAKICKDAARVIYDATDEDDVIELDDYLNRVDSTCALLEAASQQKQAVRARFDAPLDEAGWIQQWKDMGRPTVLPLILFLTVPAKVVREVAAQDGVKQIYCEIFPEGLSLRYTDQGTDPGYYLQDLSDEWFLADPAGNRVYRGDRGGFTGALLEQTLMVWHWFLLNAHLWAADTPRAACELRENALVVKTICKYTDIAAYLHPVREAP